MTDDVDVLVLGGGPAGAATARALALGGRSVALIGRRRGTRPRIGETVPPAVVRPLAALGVWDAFAAAGHVAVPGTVVCWGSDRPYERESVLDPYGCAWHLDRDRFDSMLLDAAGAAGARVQDLPPGAGSLEHDGRCWRVRLGRRSLLRAPFLVDACGRGARTPALRGARRSREDRLVALLRYGRATGADPRTFVESTAAGWWYAAALPGDRAVAALFTDADLLPATAAQRERLWTEAWSATRVVGQVLAPDGAARAVGARAEPGCVSPCAGADWAAVGDAARTLDPLSGHGLTTACESALRTAEALLQPRRAPALADLSARTAAEHRAHVAARLGHYRRERRWAGSPFWRRRHDAPAVAVP